MADTTNNLPAKPAPSTVTETSNKFKVAMRYLGSNATGGLTVFVALGMVSPDQQAEILKSATQMYEATYAFVGAAANLWFVVGPLLAVWLAKAGVNASGWVEMVNKVFAAAKAGDLGAKVVLVNAAASPDIGTRALINPELAPLGATASNVVVSPAAVTQAVPQNPAPAS